MAAHLLSVVVALPHQMPEKLPPKTERLPGHCRVAARLREVAPGSYSSLGLGPPCA